MSSEVDLHIHTVFSDGLYTPSEIVGMACRQGLQVIAISDHASVTGVPEAIEAARDARLEVIPGVEISTGVGGFEAHILGYFVECRSQELRAGLRGLRESRLARIRKMLTRLDALGMAVPLGQVQELARGGTLGRPHVAKAMVELRFVGSTQEAFQRYLGRGKPGYVPRSNTTPADAFRLIRGAGGIPVLAHPWAVTSQVPDLVAGGLMGLEAYYTGYTPGMTTYLVELAHRYDLVCTGGSDFHGLALLPDDHLGGVDVPRECVEALRKRHRLLAEAG